jgi:PAS domain-containing protein
VKHLVQANVEKEEALKKAREDLEQRKRKLEDDEKNQQDPSDPESTTSSLTVSSDSTSSDRPEHSSRSTDNAKKEDPEFSEENDPGTSDENKRKTGSSKGKKLTLSSHESSLSSSVSSGGDEGDGSGSDKKDQAQGMSTLMGRGTMGASISDLTDSNRGGTSSSEGHSSGNSGQTQSEEAGERNESPGEDGGNRARGGGSEGGTGSVSSDAAVARGQDNHGHETCHADVVVTRVRKRKSPSGANYNDTNAELHTYEVSPIDTTFQLDYEEVFLNSNVPQILATTSGRIVAWNDFFLRLTGLNADEVERLTFFSLVPPQHLSSLFEIVAAALRSGAESAVDDAASTDDINSNTEATNVDQPLAEDSTTEASQNNAISSKKIWNYSALTLPCITFEPSAHQRRKLYSSYSLGDNDEPQTGEAKRPSSPASLFITVTLMTDEDPRKRCFHCIFTDCPGTKGSMGSVTPELLSHLFSKRPNSTSGHEATSSKRKRHHRSSHV